MSQRRGSVLFAVMVVVVLSALAASGVLLAVDAGASGTATRQVGTQSRSMAWSGLQGAMVELAEQRESLLAGESPTLTGEWTLFEEGRRRGVIRLIEVEPGNESTAVPEAGKINVNAASAEILAALPGMDEAIAERIVEARDDAGHFFSLEELLHVEGVTRQLLFGDELDAESASRSPQPAFNGADSAGLDRPLSRYLTAFTADPNLQSGAGDNEEHKGRQRVNLNVEWSDRLGRAIADRFDQQAANVVQGLMRQGETFETRSDMIRVLRQFGVSSDYWGEVLDVFSTTDDRFVLGLVDLNHAPAAVLAAIPGITEDEAEEIVNRRDGLDQTLRRSASWIVEEGIISGEGFQEAANHLTTRSMQWRVRVEAGIERSTRIDTDGPIRISGTGLDEVRDDARLIGRVVYEAVIDVASSRPRLAYLRDVTALESARGLMAYRDDLRTELRLEAVSSDQRRQEPETRDDPAPDPEQDPDGTSTLEPDRPTLVNRPDRSRPGADADTDPQEQTEQDAAGEPEGEDPRLGRWRSRAGGAD